VEREKLSSQRSITWIVFCFNLAAVLLTLISVAYPALIIRTLGGFLNYVYVNPYQTGILALPLVVTNSAIFAVLVLYFKKKLPPPIKRLIDFLFNFEITPKIAFGVIVVLLGLFAVFSFGQLFAQEQWSDYYLIRQQYQGWKITDVEKGLDTHVKFFLLATSLHVFGNDKVIPFLGSMALLVLVYFISVKLTNKRFAGVVSMIIVLSSNTFLKYHTSPTYDNFWILFYLLSIYLILKKWPLSLVSYVLSIFSKALTAIYFPMTFFFIYQANIPRKKKYIIALLYGILVLVLVTGFLVGVKIVHQGTREFSPHDFWSGFSAVSFELRYDQMIVLSLLPLSVGLLIASRKGVAYADSILLYIAVFLFMPSLLGSLTPYPNEPYRFMPLIIFYAIGIALLLSKKINPPVQG
jgi:hypothetical protein